MKSYLLFIFTTFIAMQSNYVIGADLSNSEPEYCKEANIKLKKIIKENNPKIDSKMLYTEISIYSENCNMDVAIGECLRLGIEECETFRSTYEINNPK